jgi:hypothetical protein
MAPTKKNSRRKKNPQRVTVHLDEKPRKKNLPRTAFKKGNTVGFKPGSSPCPGGKPKSGEKRLLSKALNVFMSDRAPDEVGKSLGLPVNEGAAGYHYSWAQCLAKRILNLAVRGEAWAVSEISRLTEPVQSRFAFGGLDSEDAGAMEMPPIFELVMVTSDGNGRVSKESLTAHPDLAVKTIEGQTSKPALSASED